MLILPHWRLLATFKVLARAISPSRVALSKMVFMMLVVEQQTYNIPQNKQHTTLDKLKGQMRQFLKRTLINQHQNRMITFTHSVRQSNLARF